MLSPLTQIAITLLHDIAMHEPHEAIGHCTSPEELRYIYTRLEQKGMICRNEKEKVKTTEDVDADTYTTCSYKLCRPLCEISLLEVLEAIDGHLNCNHPTTEAFYTRYGKVAQKLGVVNYITRLYLSEIKLIDC
ncbi:hypothetical protein [Bacteroides clarus]|uniref:hypothetical protein n=1 Tax=Bacteroides clarus TaxID=626929 RepID=UPI00248F4482|nr:hypothetical protein [Bacteroides clarus]